MHRKTNMSRRRENIDSGALSDDKHLQGSEDRVRTLREGLASLSMKKTNTPLLTHTTTKKHILAPYRTKTTQRHVRDREIKKYFDPLQINTLTGNGVNL